MADIKFKNKVKAEAGVSLPASTASRALTVGAGGDITSSATTATELGYLSGVTSAVQTQINGKTSSTLTQDHILVGNGSGVATDVAMSGEASIVASGAVTLSNSAVIGKVLTGYTSGAGTISAADSILSAIQKANGNDALKLPLAGGTMSGNIAMGSNKITGLADGTAAGDAVNKGQMDAALEGLKPKAAVRAATTADITIATALNSGDLLDGVTLANGDRVLVKDQSTASQNGIYIVSATPTRSTDFDSTSPIDEINGAIVAVEEGTANAGKIFVQSGAAVVTVGTDPINFVFFNSSSSLVGGDGITVSGSNISVDHDGEGLTFSTAQLALELDGTTLSKSATGVKVAALGITNSEVATAAAIAYSKLAALTASRALVSDGSGVVSVSAVTSTELGYVSGVTSAIQTQLGGKEPTITTLPVSKGGTNSGTALNNDRIMVSSAGAIVEAAALTNGQLLIGSTGAAPSAASLTAGSGITITPGAGSITIAASVAPTAGDISLTSFSAANNQAAAANVTGFAFANASVRSFKAQVSVAVDATADLFETFDIMGVQKGSSWDMSVTAVGDDSGFVFSITTAGQIQYTNLSYAGFVSATVKFRATVTTV